LEVRVAQLEAENEALVSESKELQRKLVELLQRWEHRTRKLRRSQPEEEPSTGEPEAASQESKGSEATDYWPEHRNAVQLVNEITEVYNEEIARDLPPEKRAALVEKKLDRFCEYFHSDIRIIELTSSRDVIRRMAMFRERYGCVFRESGAGLRCVTQKRFYYDAEGGKPTYVLDYEVHESLVTAVLGEPKDGSRGVRPPRTEHLAVLYEERGGKLTRMWIKQDRDMLGPDPDALEEAMVKSELFREFQEALRRVKKGWKTGPFFFSNYLDTPTVG